MTQAAPAQHVARFGDFQIDLQSGELSQNGTRLPLADQPFRLLVILIRERGRLVSREKLCHELWPEGTFVDFEPSLNAAVKRLRESLGDSATTPRFIETLPKRGYRFIASVEEDDGQREDPSAAEGEPAPTGIRERSEDAGDAAQPPPRGGGFAARLSHRRIGVAAVAAVGLLGLALLALALTTIWWRSAGTTGVLPNLERLTSLGTVRLASVSLDGTAVAYVRVEGVRQSLWLKRNDDPYPVQLLEPVEGIYRTLTFAAGDFIHYTLFRADKALIEPFRISTRGGAPEPMEEPAGGIAFHPDGSRYALVSTFSQTLRESRIVVADAAGPSTRVLTLRKPPQSFVRTKPAWSPDGSRLAVFGVSEAAPSSLELLVVDAGDGQVLKSQPIDLVWVESLLWLPDGTRIVVSGRQRRATPQRLWVVSLASGAMHPLTTDLSDYALAGLIRDGRVLVAVRGDVARSVWAGALNDIGAARQIAQDSGDLSGMEGMAWGREGTLLYSAAEAGNVDIWSVNVRDGRRQRLTVDRADDFQPSVSGDGGTIVFASNRDGVPGIWAMNADGGDQRRLTSGGDSRPSVSADGRVVVFQRGTVDTTPFALWRMPIVGSEPAPIGPPHSMRPAVSPDGSLVAHYHMTAQEWLLAVTPVAGGNPLQRLPISRTHKERVVRWSADGHGLAFIDEAGGASNIWLQPLDGRPPRKLTSFSDGHISTFDWSRDGTKLAWTRVTEVRDLVTLEIGSR